MGIISLTQSNLSILSDLNKVCSSEIIDIILDNLEGSQISSFEQVYLHIKEFHEKTGKFPEKDYLSERFPATCRFPDFCANPTAGALQIFLSELKKEHLIYKAATIVSEGDLGGLEDIVSEFKTSRVKEVNRSFSTVADSYVERKKLGSGISTGIADIDSFTGGLGYGTLTTIAAPSGAGKTSIARSIAYNVVYNEPKNVVFFSLEISEFDMKAQILARHSKAMGRPISGRDIIKGTLEPAYRDGLGEREVEVLDKKVEASRNLLKVLSEDFERNSKGCLFIVEQSDVPDWTPGGFKGYLEKIDEEMMEKTGRGIDVVILDYISIVTPRVLKSGMDIKEFRNIFIQQFRASCVNFRGRQLIGILLQQINRTGNKNMDTDSKKSNGKIIATFQDIAELNSIERESSVVIVAYSNPVIRASEQIYMQVIKNRLGSCMEAMVPVRADFKHNHIGEGGSIIAEVINANALDCPELNEGFDSEFSIEQLMV